MALPTLITVVGTYLKLDGTPESGTIIFRSKQFVQHNSSSDIMAPSEISAELNGAGHFTIQVPATDDPAWTPVDWTYKISVNLSESVSTFSIRIPYNAPGGSISLSDILPVAASIGISYAPYNHTHAGYVSEADLNEAVAGAIEDVAGPAIDAAVDDALASSLSSYAPKASPAFTGTVTGITKSMVGLANVDNTADLDKPISTATQTALNGKSATTHNHDTTYVPLTVAAAKGDILVATGAGSVSKISVGSNGSVLKADSTQATGLIWGTDNTGGGGGAVSSVAGRTGDVVLTKSDVSLGNVDNTADTAKPISTATQTALDGKQALDSDLTAIAAIAPTNDDIIQRKAGAWTNRSVTQFKSDLALTKSDVGLANVDNTADTAKPVSTAQQTALNLKANLASPTFSGTVSGITKSMVGLGSVDNTADTAKPVSTAQQTALDLKANLASPTFTGTVAGISKSMVGLGNVDNTADTAKPISTLTQAALDLKAPLASPTFTGTVTAPNATLTGNLSVAGIGSRITLWRTSAHAGRTSTTLSDDDMLTTTLSLGTWVIEVALAFKTNTASDVTCDFQVAYTVPTGTTLNRINIGPNASLSAVTGTADKVILMNSGYGPGTALVYGTNGTNGEMIMERLIYTVTTAGTFAVKWARSGASGTAILDIGSHFTAEKVA